MVCGTEHIFYGTESTTPIPTTFMIGKYGETKCISEKLVLEASGTKLANGNHFVNLFFKINDLFN